MIYIANDVESAGSRLGVHSTLSWGACVITREALSFEEYVNKGLVFYTELRPDSECYEIEAMRVGCSQLSCLERCLDGCAYDTNSPDFRPDAVLELMQRNCERPVVAVSSFHWWVEQIKKQFKDEKVVGVTDTVFFDGGRVDALLGKYSVLPSPFGHSGLDMDSIYRGYVKRADAKLKELGVPDTRTRPHRADHDAVYLAQMARELLFNRMGW